MNLIRRLAASLGVIWLAATLAFFALRVLPGDAVQAQLLGSGASASAIAERRAALGLDDPALVQYGRWLAGIGQGSLGVSLLDGQPVAAMIGQRLAPTLALALSALLVAVVLGICLGGTAGLERGKGSRLAALLLDLALSMPMYWTGTLAIWLFAVQLGWLPFSQSSDVQGLILPAVVLGFHSAGAIGRVFSASVREAKDADFVRTARAKGLPEHAVLSRHIARASLLSAVTVIALQAGFLLSGIVITETLFVRPGIGRLLLDSVLRQDYPVVQGIVVWMAIVYTAVNAAADVIYALVDPRVSAQ